MRNSPKVEEKIKEVSDFIENLLKDTSIPKNVRVSLQKSVEYLNKKDDEQTVRISNAIYEIQQVSNDVNLPIHARTFIWQVLGMLERIKK